MVKNIQRLYEFFTALMYCSVNTAIEKARGTEDMYNSVAAAVTTGALFKSTGKKLFNGSYLRSQLSL